MIIPGFPGILSFFQVFQVMCLPGFPGHMSVQFFHVSCNFSRKFYQILQNSMIIPGLPGIFSFFQVFHVVCLFNFSMFHIIFPGFLLNFTKLLDNFRFSR